MYRSLVEIEKLSQDALSILQNICFFYQLAY